MSRIRICTFDDIMSHYPRKTLKVDKYVRFVCPKCSKQFTPPKFSFMEIVICPHCGHEDEV